MNIKIVLSVIALLCNPFSTVFAHSDQLVIESSQMDFNTHLTDPGTITTIQNMIALKGIQSREEYSCDYFEEAVKSKDSTFTIVTCTSIAAGSRGKGYHIFHRNGVAIFMNNYLLYYKKSNGMLQIQKVETDWTICESHMTANGYQRQCLE